MRTENNGFDALLRQRQRVRLLLNRFVGVVILLMAATLLHAESSNCQALGKDAASKLAEYVSKKFDLAADTEVRDLGLAGDTCVRRLSFRSASMQRSIALYLSPDQRFLTSDLLDTALDPVADKDRATAEVQRNLLARPSPARGPVAAKITLVEFSDFQCPYCKRLSDFLAELPQEDRDEIRIIFKHLPLPMHPWASRAAIAAACAAEQSTSSFWRMHDFFFAKQAVLAPSQFDEALEAFVRTEKDLNFTVLNACIRAPSNKTIQADEALAKSYGVDATPTVFLNGIRKLGFGSEQELKIAIAQAKEQEPRVQAEPKPF